MTWEFPFKSKTPTIPHIMILCKYIFCFIRWQKYIFISFFTRYQYIFNFFLLNNTILVNNYPHGKQKGRLTAGLFNGNFTIAYCLLAYPQSVSSLKLSAAGGQFLNGRSSHFLLYSSKKSFPLSSVRIKAGIFLTTIFLTASIPSSSKATTSTERMFSAASTAAGPPIEPR